MMNNKILTIVIPTYNMEKYLDKCLTSLIIEDKELMKQLEVLVVIDGAKDRSSEIAHNYQEKFPQTFRVIDKENGNYGSCVNRGLKEATGKYIKILDADDSFDNPKFSSFLAALDSVNVDMVLSDYSIVDEFDSTRKEFRIGIPPKQELQFDDFCLIEEILCIQMHEVAYRTDMLRDFGYKQSEGISYTDREWVFSPLSRVNTVYYYDEKIYRYLVGREGQTMDPEVLVRNINHSMKGLLKMAEYYETTEDLSVYKQSLLTHLIGVRIKNIYKLFLLSNKTTLDNSLLIQLDNTIRQQYPRTFNLTNQIALGKTPLKYIKYWRNNNFLYKLCKLFYFLLK